MPVTTSNPTSNTTPDPGQGGNAVTDNTNTGHGDTTVGAGLIEFKTCLWTSFPAVSVGGQIITAIILKADWSLDGGGGGGSNQFLAQYSLNGGSTWNDLFFMSALGPNSGSSQAILPTDQSISQVRVRDSLSATGGVETLTGSISNIRLEVTSQDGLIIIMM